MADFTSALEQLRGAIETGEGSATTPTRILSLGPAGNVDAGDLLNRANIEDRRAAGTRTSLRDLYSGIEDNMLRISSIPMSYQEVGWWLTLLAPTGGAVPGTVDTSAYTRTFTPTEGTSTNTYGTGYYTANLEYSSLDFESTLVYQMPAMAITNLTMNFDKRASGTDTGAMLDLEFTMTQGTATQGTAFNGSLSQGTPTLIIGNQLTSYVDDDYGSIGSTADDQVMSASFNLVNPLTWHDGMDGTNAHTSGHWAQQWTPTMTLTRRFSDTTELDAYVARTTRAVRIHATGDVVGGSTATNQFYLDFVGKITDFNPTLVDGLWYAEIPMEAVYDSTLTTSWSTWLQNATAAAYTAT